MSLLFFFKPLWRPGAEYRPFKKQKRKVYRIRYEKEPIAEPVDFTTFAQDLLLDKRKRQQRKEDKEAQDMFSVLDGLI